MIGRKLNTRLAELKMQSKETMSKQQLQKLFEHERDKELERLGEISEAAKIFGRAGDVVDMELDLEAGSFQLVALDYIVQVANHDQECDTRYYKQGDQKWCHR